MFDERVKDSAKNIPEVSIDLKERIINSTEKSNLMLERKSLSLKPAIILQRIAFVLIVICFITVMTVISISNSGNKNITINIEEKVKNKQIKTFSVASGLDNSILGLFSEEVDIEKAITYLSIEAEFVKNGNIYEVSKTDEKLMHILQDALFIKISFEDESEILFIISEDGFVIYKDENGNYFVCIESFVINYYELLHCVIMVEIDFHKKFLGSKITRISFLPNTSNFVSTIYKTFDKEDDIAKIVSFLNIKSEFMKLEDGFEISNIKPMPEDSIISILIFFTYTDSFGNLKQEILILTANGLIFFKDNSNNNFLCLKSNLIDFDEFLRLFTDYYKDSNE